MARPTPKTASPTQPQPQPQPTGRLPKTQRVRKRAEFQLIQSQGRRITTPRFVLLIHAREPTAGLDSARLGITASRRVGTAVVRARSKRLIREAFRATRDLWAADVDVVFIARRSLSAAGLSNVVAELRGAARAIEKRTREARNDQKKREHGAASGDSALAKTL